MCNVFFLSLITTSIVNSSSPVNWGQGVRADLFFPVKKIPQKRLTLLAKKVTFKSDG